MNALGIHLAAVTGVVGGVIEVWILSILEAVEWKQAQQMSPEYETRSQTEYEPIDRQIKPSYFSFSSQDQVLRFL